MINESAIKSVFEDSFKMQSYDSCLIITDSEKKPIADAFYAYARKKVGDKAKLIEIPVGTRHGEEPPSDVVVQMLLFDVELLITTYSLSHTTARRNASQNGIRIASMPNITPETVNRCLNIDYGLLKKRCEELYQKIEHVKEITIKTDLGTHITLKRGDNSLHGKKGADLSEYGAFGNLPDGEICFAPEEAEGICFIDASVGGIGKLDAPLKIVIEKSKAVSIEGPATARLKKILDAAGPKAYDVAELGIGLNPDAMVCGSVLEDEKSRGTAHIAFGNNLSFGGNNDVPIHIDCVMKNVQIFFDGQEIDRP